VRHRPTILLIVGLLVLSLAGCAITPGQKDRQHQKQVQEKARRQLNQAERQRLEKEFEQFDRVTYVSVAYNDVWPEKGSVSVSFVLPLADRNGQPQERIYDAVARAVWLSRIEPLDRVRVRIGWHNSEGQGIDDPSHTILSGDTGRAELAQRYGPRPTGASAAS
jgi:hypothetical protein